MQRYFERGGGGERERGGVKEREREREREGGGGRKREFRCIFVNNRNDVLKTKIHFMNMCNEQ